MATTTTRIQHIYYERGEEERRVAAAPIDADLPRIPSVADLVSVVQIMSRGVACARGELDIAAVTERMLRDHIGCLPVVNARGMPVGMITKHDLVEQGQGRRHVVPLTARELMTPIAFTLGAHASVAHAAAMMATEDIHHVAIVDDAGVLIGVVSSLDIVRWLAANDGFTVGRR